ncbi:MAG: hypothetical protein IPN96_11985 [Anaerolineales bacterium]|nr:hypothetical protein [Anaerolineales bacterium]
MTRWLDPHPVEIPASFLTLNLPPFIAQILLRRESAHPKQPKRFYIPM